MSTGHVVLAFAVGLGAGALAGAKAEESVTLAACSEEGSGYLHTRSGVLICTLVNGEMLYQWEQEKQEQEIQNETLAY